MWHARVALRLFTCLGTLWAWPAVTSTFSDDFYKARPVVKPCPNCTTSAAPRSFVDLQEQIELEAQLQRIKQKIIDGLGLKDIPGITSSPGTPAPPPKIDPAKELRGSEEIEGYHLDDIIATSEPPDGIYTRSVLQFSLPNSLDKKIHVRRGYLYVFLKKRKRPRKKRRITIRISTVNDKGKPLKLLSKIRMKLKESGWQKIGLPADLMTKVLENPNTPLKLHIRCKKCKGAAKPVMVEKLQKRSRKRRLGSTRLSLKRKAKLNRNRPRLLIQTKTLKIRSKRHLVSCRRSNREHSHPHNETLAIGNNSCCKLSYFLNFTEIGWGDWIISPEGTLVSVCEGGCPNRRGSSRAAVLGLSSPRRRNRQCQPTRSSDLTITYFDQSLHIVQKRMRDMVVSNCGCRSVT